jgi:hypothetical protein
VAGGDPRTFWAITSGSAQAAAFNPDSWRARSAG